MIPINTPLTRRLNITTPIVAAPMAFASTPELAAAVTAAGGFGCIGAGFDSTLVLKTKIQQVRTTLGIANGEPVPMAIGFIGWILEMTESSDDPLPAAVWFAFGVDLDKYVDEVQAYNKRTGRTIFIFVIVHSVDDVRRAAMKGVDAVVVQGIEAGGHGRGDAPPLFVLLQAVLSEVQSNGGPLVLAAGGISTGAQIASLLTMGADGVVLGTRFPVHARVRVLECTEESARAGRSGGDVRTLAYDEVGRTNGWPPNYNGRAISNEVMNDYRAGMTLDERIEKFDESAREGRRFSTCHLGCVGVGLTSEIKGAADVLGELHEETVARLQCATRLLA
ncbi:hypothetical protein B0H13DRAFT_2053106 [Mycena leptocephala]|nr:hypothetical protein B0H13DRAFT_2053106 [Mycena leptocephala]